MKKELPKLPKLPKGMGAYDHLPNGDIRYRKSVKGTRISVTGTTISEVNKLMKQKEDETLKRIKIGIKKESTGTLQENMNEWMTLYKKEDVIPRTYDRIESTYLTHIVGSELGTMQEKSIKPEDIQRFMKELKNHGDKKEDKDLSYSSKKKVYELLNQYFRYRYIKEGRLEVNHMEYRGFTIQENKMKYVYGNKKWEVTNYLVYKEDNGEKYFLPNVTAFDSIDKAKEVIDDMFKMEE